MTFWEIIQGAEYLIAKVLIKVQRLEVKCVQVGFLAAASNRFRLRKPHHLSSKSATAKTFGYPQQAYKEPTPVGFAKYASNYLLSLISQEKTKLAQVEFFNPGFIEFNQIPFQRLDISFGRWVFHRDPVRFPVHF
jgi:hypothetical protein